MPSPSAWGKGGIGSFVSLAPEEKISKLDLSYHSSSHPSLLSHSSYLQLRLLCASRRQFIAFESIVQSISTRPRETSLQTINNNNPPITHPSTTHHVIHPYHRGSPHAVRWNPARGLFPVNSPLRGQGIGSSYVKHRAPSFTRRIQHLED